MSGALERFLRHARHFGPDGVYEAAAAILPPDELAALADELHRLETGSPGRTGRPRTRRAAPQAVFPRPDETRNGCPVCGVPPRRSRRGPAPVYCSPACRQTRVPASEGCRVSRPAEVETASNTLVAARDAFTPPARGRGAEAPLSLTIPEELVERIAERAAAIVAGRLRTAATASPYLTVARGGRLPAWEAPARLRPALGAAPDPVQGRPAGARLPRRAGRLPRRERLEPGCPGVAPHLRKAAPEEGFAA